MARYFLQLSYNGKNYHGWQVQENAHSVQAELNTALNTFLKTNVDTLGCGRTDTGVHAKVFYVHFDVKETIAEPENFLHHINCLLPKDIAVQKLIPVHDKAHARYDATSRTYQYFIHHYKNPFLDEYSYRFPYELDLARMNEAAKILFDHSDFSCFSKSRTQVLTNICKITAANWSRTNEQLMFEITADRFLRNMVRAIVGTMLDIGEGKIGIEDFTKIIEGKSRRDAGFSVPAHGLYLVDVSYPENIFLSI